MFTHDCHDNKCPIVALHALDQPLVEDIWRRSNAMYHAILVILLTTDHVDYLQAHDPQLLKQLVAARALAETPTGAQ